MQKYLGLSFTVLIAFIIGLNLGGWKQKNSDSITGFSGQIATLSTPSSSLANSAATTSLFAGGLFPDGNNQFDIGAVGSQWRNIVMGATFSQRASNGAQYNSNGGLLIDSSFSSTSMRIGGGTTSTIEIRSANPTSTFRVVADRVTSTLFVSTTAPGVGSRIILVQTGGNTCAQMYISSTLAIGANSPAQWEGVACPDIQR